MTREPRFIAVGHLTRLRRFTRRDVDRWLAWPPHPDPLYSSFDPTPMTGSMRDAWYDDLVHRQGQLPFAIETFDRQMIGRLFLRHIRRVEASSVLGIDLDPRFLGRGLGTDALRAFLGHYFASGAFVRMLLSVGAHNERAHRSYQSCGFRGLGSHWERFSCRIDVLGDPRYANIRHLFRRGPGGLQALMYDMVAERPASASRERSPSAAVSASPRMRPPPR